MYFINNLINRSDCYGNCNTQTNLFTLTSEYKIGNLLIGISVTI